MQYYTARQEKTMNKLTAAAIHPVTSLAPGTVAGHEFGKRVE